jgi:hypothetical protein
VGRGVSGRLIFFRGRPESVSGGIRSLKIPKIRLIKLSPAGWSGGIRNHPAAPVLTALLSARSLFFSPSSSLSGLILPPAFIRLRIGRGAWPRIRAPENPPPDPRLRKRGGARDFPGLPQAATGRAFPKPPFRNREMGAFKASGKASEPR